MFDVFVVFLLSFVLSAIIYIECWKLYAQRRLSGFGVPKHVPILGVANRFIGKSNDELVDIFNEMFSEVQKINTPLRAWFGPQLVNVKFIFFISL